MDAEPGVSPNYVTFNTLIACAARCKQPEKAKQLFATMQRRDFRPTEHTYGALLAAMASASNVDIDG